MESQDERAIGVNKTVSASDQGGPFIRTDKGDIHGDQNHPPNSEKTLISEMQAGIRRIIENRWRSYFPGLAGGSAPAVVCRKGADIRGYSVLLRYQLVFPGAGTKWIIAKIRRESHFGRYQKNEISEKAISLCLAEYEGLSRAERTFSDRGPCLKVVKPFDYLSEYNALLVEQAKGCDLGILAKAEPPDCLLHFHRCGEWLRIFHHEVYGAYRKVWDASQYEARLMRWNERLAENGVPMTRLDPMIASVLSLVRALFRPEVPCSMLHGDYKLRHVWASSDGIEVFDFGNLYEGECYSDVAAFLVELEVLSLARPWFAPEKIKAYAAAFLNGYFDNQPIPSILSLYIIDGLLKKWDRRLKRWSSHRSVIYAQNWLRHFGASAAVDRFYLDRWFASRIEKQLTSRNKA